MSVACVLSCQLCTHPDAVARHTCPFGEAEVMGKGRRASMKSGRARGERHQLCGVCCPGGGTQGTGSLLSIPPVWAARAAQPTPCWICSGIPALGHLCQPFPAAARKPGCAEQTPGSGGVARHKRRGDQTRGASSTPLTSSPLRNRREEMARRRMGGGGGGVRRQRNKERSGGRAAAGGGGEREEGWGGRRSSRGGGCRRAQPGPGTPLLGGSRGPIAHRPGRRGARVGSQHHPPPPLLAGVSAGAGQGKSLSIEFWIVFLRGLEQFLFPHTMGVPYSPVKISLFPRISPQALTQDDNHPRPPPATGVVTLAGDRKAPPGPAPHGRCQ